MCPPAVRWDGRSPIALFYHRDNVLSVIRPRFGVRGAFIAKREVLAYLISFDAIARISNAYFRGVSPVAIWQEIS